MIWFEKWGKFKPWFFLVFMWKGCKISENILVLVKKGIDLSSNFSLFSHKKGVKLLKISLEKGSFSILRPTMEYPFFMEVPVPGMYSTVSRLVEHKCKSKSNFYVKWFVFLSLEDNKIYICGPKWNKINDKLAADSQNF